jgi:hypothetical protein
MDLPSGPSPGASPVNAPVLFCSIASSCPPQHQPQSPSSRFSPLPSSPSPSLSPVARFTTEEFCSSRLCRPFRTRNHLVDISKHQILVALPPPRLIRPRIAPSRSSQLLDLIPHNTTSHSNNSEDEANTAARGRRGTVVCDHCHYGCIRQHPRVERC